MPPLYTASVPVFLHYLDRIEGLLGKLRGHEAVLTARILVEPGGRALDVGCGDGALLAYLVNFKQVDARGMLKRLPARH